MRAVGGVDQLAGDTQPGSRLAHTAFQYEPHTQFPGHLAHIHRAALVGEAGVAGDDEQLLEARQRRDDVFDHAIGEVILFGIATHVVKGQYCDGGPGRLVGFALVGFARGGSSAARLA